MSLHSLVQASRRPPSTSSSPLAPRLHRVKLHITFGLVVCAALPGIADGARGMFMWGAIVLGSLLVHELAHAGAGMAWGSRATIVLHPFGGTTKMDPPLSIRRSIVARLAGPLASLGLGLGFAWLRTKVGAASWLSVAMWVNLGLGALNLLPVLPFDGGHVALQAIGPSRAKPALVISIAITAAIAIVGLAFFRSAAITVVFGASTFASAFAWCERHRKDVEARLGIPAQLERAASLLAEARYREALSLADAAAENARSNATERKARELAAWSALGLGRASRAKESLARIRPSHSVDVYCWAAVEDAYGRPDHAVVGLEAAHKDGKLGPEAVKLLIDLHVRQNDLAAACRIAGSAIAILGADDARRVLAFVLEAGPSPAALALAGKLFEATSLPEDGVVYAHGLAQLGRESAARAVLARVAGVQS